MNQRFKELLTMLNKQADKPVSKQQLIDSLRLISAHHNLEAIVICTYRIFELEEQFPDLLKHPIDNLAPRLSVLKRISELEFADQHFKQSHMPEDSPTPLYSYTGDSPICELMLLERYDGTEQENYHKVLAWFVWLAIRYHAQALKPDRYEAYLLSTDGRPRLISNKHSGRIAAAARHIRQLADPTKANDLSRLVKLGLQFSSEAGQGLALLAEQVRGSNGVTSALNAVERFASETDYEYAKERLITVRDSVSPPMRFIWRLMWVSGTSGRSSPSHVSRQNNEVRRLFGSKAGRYGDTIAIGRKAGGTHVVDVVRQPKPPKDPPLPKDAIEEVDDDDLPPKEPTYQLVLEDTDDLIQGYYAAKGAQYAIEYQNAQLPWSQHRLSQRAIKELLENELVYRAIQIPENLAETKKQAILAKRGGQVLIGLSLVTGRSLEELRAVEILPFAYRWKSASSVQVDIANSTLRVTAGTPKLSQKARAKLEGSAIFSPHGETAQIKLPKFLQELLGDGSWLGEGHLRAKRYRAAADKIIRDTPSGYGYSRASIRDALLFELLGQNKGDLGIVKVITDRNGLNYSNLIHYASYSETTACDCWAKAAAAVIGQHPKSLSVASGPADNDLFGERTLGTPDAIDEVALRKQIVKVQQRLNQRIEEGAGILVFNLMTLYTLLWLNLATASRGRVNPAPVAIIGNTALVSDKHRDDDSAERPVPLTEGVQQQMRAYVAYVWNLSLTIPQLKPLSDSLVNGVLRFQFINNNNQIVNFRPKWLYESEALIPMPGNWARKYIQAQLVSIGGRIQNAMNGHWVMGRHPYRTTSNYCAKEADALWLEGQVLLEASLGLRVIAHPKVPKPAIDWPVPLKLVAPSCGAPKQTPEKKAKAVLKKKEVEAAFVEHAEGLYEAIRGTDEKVPAAVMSLIMEVCKAYSDDRKREIQVAKDCCDYARKQWKVAIYVNKPRRQFQKDWLTKRNAFVNLAFLKERGLPQFEKELTHLPPVEADDHQIARFLMLMMWRQGLTTWPVINHFIEGYLEGGARATAGLRYVSVTLRCRRNGARMPRLIYLEPYCAIYLAAEQSRLKSLLSDLNHLNPQKRRAKCQRLLATYLYDVAGVKTTHLFTTLLQAAQQYHLLNGSPLLAAYAAGEFETHDLPENELRHLLGLSPQLGSTENSQVTESYEATFRPESAGLPSVELARASNPVHALATIRSPDPKQRLSSIQKLTEKGVRNKLLGHFAGWLHKKELRPVKNKLPQSEKRRYQSIIEVIGYSLFGFCAEPNKYLKVDESLLCKMHDSFVDHHPHILTKEPFGLFRKYLRQRGTVGALGKLGISVGDVEPGQLHGVLSKMVLPVHQEQVIEALKSARSGIGSPEVREAAISEMKLVGTYGLRRTEAANLRLKDVQKNLMRVQPFGGHTLKSDWSLRNLPINYAEKPVQTWLKKIDSSKTNQLIAPEGWLDGNRFFDPLNKLIQAITGDPQSHLHIIRHTVASQLLLSMLVPSVRFDAITPHFPWLDQLLIPTGRLQVLLGNEGFTGHGIQAISALLGHSHPTTTLRYYIHTVGIAQLAYLHTLPRIDLDRSFEYRIKSPSTMRRRQREWREETDQLDDEKKQAHIYEVLKTLIDPDLEKLDQSFSGFRKLKTISEDVTEEASRQIYFERFERLHAVLTGQAQNETDEDLDEISSKLQELSSIQTAKRGSHAGRHKIIDINGIQVPKPLPARSPTTAAAIFCEYLEELRRKSSEDLSWLIMLWRNQAQGKLARVRLSEDDVARWRTLPDTEFVRPKIETVIPARKKKQAKANVHKEHYGRFELFDDTGEIFDRASSAVRWAMTWLCAIEGLVDSG